MHVHQFRLGVIVAVASLSLQKNNVAVALLLLQKHLLNEDKRFVPT